jgi:hypothetical protein
MRRGRLLAMGVLVMVAAAVTVLGQPAMASAPLAADFEVRAGTAHGKVGDVVTISAWYRNNGPSDASTGTVTVETKLPGGAEFFSKNVPANCTEIVPRKHVTCRNPGFWPKGYKSPPQLRVTIVSTKTSPGFISVTYAGDPKPANNMGTLTLTIDGVVKPKPTPTTAPAITKAALKPTTRPTPTRSAVASTAAASPSADVVGLIEPSTAAAADDEPTAMILIAVGGGLLAAVIVFGAAYGIHRRGQRGEPGTE